MNKVVKVTMEEGQVALLDRYAAERGVVESRHHPRNASLRRWVASVTPLRIFRLLSAVLIGLVMSRVLRWSASSTLFSLKLCLSLGRQPALIYKACNGFLLLKVQAEERVAEFAKFLLRVAVVDVAAEAFQGEEPTGGERHNEKQRWSWSGDGRNRLRHSFLLHGI